MEEFKKPKRLTPAQAKTNILRYCAYQERSHHEVRDKLFSYGLYASEVNDIISYLITENFLKEERYAKAFAGGKFRMKKWGRLKITQALKRQGIKEKLIEAGLKEIDEKNYRHTLAQLLDKKRKTITNTTPTLLNKKLYHYALSKGYEPELIWAVLKGEGLY